MVKRFVCYEWNQTLISLALLLFVVGSSKVSADYGIPPDTPTQPPTRYVWLQTWPQFAGTTEQLLSNQNVFSSPKEALDPQREGVCLEQGGPWLCHQNEVLPDQDGWMWGFRFCRTYEPGYCGWKAASLHGVCPSSTSGYYIPRTAEGGWYHGFIACSVPPYPDGEKDLAKPPVCGDNTPNPIHIGLGRKQAIEHIYRTEGNVFPIDFQFYYQHNDKKRLGITWRHSYYKWIVLDGQKIPTSARIYRGRGAFLFRRDQATGEWRGDDDVNDSLIELVDTNHQRQGWKYIDRLSDRTENYDVAGRLVSIEDRGGLIHTLTYDPNGNLINIIDSFGQQLTFTHDAYGNFATLTDPAGGFYQFTFASNGNLLNITYPDNKTRIYHYNEPSYTNNTHLPHALTGITDENGVRYATYTYDLLGRAIISEHAGGANRYALSYNSDHNNTIVTDPLGSQYTRYFQTIQGIDKSIRQSQPAGSGCGAAASTTTYDTQGNIASETDFNGNKTCYAFDLNRNLEIARVEGLAAASACPGDLINYTPVVNSAERKILTEWHPSLRLPVRISEAKRETNFIYDAHGSITEYRINDITTNVSRSWRTSYVYHPSIPGAVLQKTEDGPRTDVVDVTTTDYYAPDVDCNGGHLGCRGRMARITNALGHVVQVTRYNAHGQPEEIIDPNGLTSTFTYDVRQRLLSRTHGTELTRYQYDGAGQVKRITFPDNSFLAYTYDDAHRLIGMADNLGNRVQYTLDAMGNRSKEEVFDPLNTLTQSQQREFDALNRLWKHMGAYNQVTQFGYDAEGNLRQITDPLQHTFSRQFDARNHLIGTTDAVGHHIRQAYDAMDQIIQISDPRDIATTYTYNGFGDVIQEISTDRGTTTYTYDSAGNLETQMDARGVKHIYTWDALNRPIKRIHVKVAGIPGTAAFVWSYDNGVNGIGRLTSVSDASGSTTYGYDLHGRLLTKTQIARFGAINFTQTLNYQYDSMGRLTQMTYPSGMQVSTLYGADGRPTEIRVNGNVLLSNINYQPFGPARSWIWGNGQPYTRNADLDGRLKQHPMGGDTRTLIYDAAGRITSTVDSNPMYNRSYDYDPLSRLTGQSDNTSFKIWSYDANGNRNREQSVSSNYPFELEATSNRLLNAAGPVAKTYHYDAIGNPLSDGATNFVWNAAGQLHNTVNNHKKHTYKYNALGQRITKNGPLSKKQFYFYDPAGQLIGEYKNHSATDTPTDDWLLRQETIWLDNIPVAVVKKPKITKPIQIYFIYTDHLNTPRLIVDQNNTPVWRWDNVHAFGANLPNEDPDDNGQSFEYNLRFAGQYFDRETSLHYNYFRYYEPETGRYLTPDPIGLAAGTNVYGYAEQNPLSLVDPEGLLPDAIVDIGLIGLDLASLAYNKYHGCDTSTDVASLKANTIGLFVPGVTGLGAAVRIGNQAAKGTAVIGKNPDYINLANKLGAKSFSMPAEVWNKMSKAEQWNANQKFLDRVIKRGDDIVLSNPVKNINDVSGIYRKELDYLMSKGLKLSDDGTRLVK